MAPQSGTIDQILSTAMGLSPEDSLFLLNLGAIYLNHERLLAKTIAIEKGAYLRVHSQPRRFKRALLQWPSAKIFENDDFLVVNKPSGLPVHSTVDNVQENLVAMLSAEIEHELFVTHRLDVPTSGLIVFAKTKDFQKKFNLYLMQRKVQKIYRALVHGEYDGPRVLKHYMEPSPRAPKNVVKNQTAGWAACELRIQDVESTGDGNCELMIELITGRTHQIRAQLSCEGFPVVGDRAYGSPVLLGDGGHEEIALQAVYLNFPQSESESELHSESEFESFTFRLPRLSAVNRA